MVDPRRAATIRDGNSMEERTLQEDYRISEKKKTGGTAWNGPARDQILRLED